MRYLHICSLAAVALTAATPQFDRGFGKLPLRFEANTGQTDAAVRYLARGSAYALFLTEQHATLALPQGDQTAVLRMAWRGAQRPVAIEGLENAGVSHYLRGGSRVAGEVPNFQRVRYRALYPGIDLVYYGVERQLEYDFVVAPGADPGVIRLAFEGVENARIDAEGNLRLATAFGELQQKKPVLYQERNGRREPVAGAYRRLPNGEFGFTVGSYDRSRPLVIDPVLVYSLFLGGASEDSARYVATDAQGSTYVLGNTISLDFPTSTGVLRTANGGGRDLFLSKISPAGNLFVFSTYLGGARDDSAAGLHLAADGTIYVAGSTVSDDIPTTRNAYQRNRRSLADRLNGFVMRLNATGSALQWASYFGADDDEITAMAVDTRGAVYLTGQTRSTNFPATANAFQTAGFQRAFVAKLSADGQDLAYATYLGGTRSRGGLNDDFARAIAVDAAGNAYVAGNTTSTDFPTTVSAYQRQFLPQEFDATTAFITKLNPEGSGLIWSTYLGGRVLDELRAMAVNARGEVFVSGVTKSETFPTTQNAYSRAYAGALTGEFDIFLTRLEADGSRPIYSTFIGGKERDDVNAMTVDNFGNAYLCGSTLSAEDFPRTSPALQASTAGGQDAIVLAMNTNGEQLVFSTFLGGSVADAANAITLDSRGNVVVAGVTSSPDFPVTRGLAQFFFGGVRDAFLTRMAPVYLPPDPVVSAAGFVRGPLTVGQIVTIFGLGFGPPVAAETQLDPDGRVSRALAQTEVFFDEFAAPLFFVRDDQINAQVPYELGNRRSAKLRVVYRGKPTADRVVDLAVSAPSIFTYSTENNRAIVLNQNGSFNSAANPAAAGEVIVFFATGEGVISPNPITGRPATAPLPAPVLPVSVNIGGQRVPAGDVRYAGAAPGFVGLMQVNVVVPRSAPGRVPLVLTVGPNSSPLTVEMFVR